MSKANLIFDNFTMWISYYRVSLNFHGEGDRTPQDPHIGLLDFWNSELLYQKILKLKIIVICDLWFDFYKEFQWFPIHLY